MKVCEDMHKPLCWVTSVPHKRDHSADDDMQDQLLQD